MAFAPTHPVVWTEIPVRDLDAARRFYEAVFGWEMHRDEGGPNPILFIPSSDPRTGVAGHLYPGTPADGGGPTVHLQVPDRLEDAVDRARAAGAAVPEMPAVEIPFGRFRYMTDPDGNSIALFEPNAAMREG